MSGERAKVRESLDSSVLKLGDWNCLGRVAIPDFINMKGFSWQKLPRKALGTGKDRSVQHSQFVRLTRRSKLNRPAADYGLVGAGAAADAGAAAALEPLR